jgi:hypothetical protein
MLWLKNFLYFVFKKIRENWAKDMRLSFLNKILS